MNVEAFNIQMIWILLGVTMWVGTLWGVFIIAKLMWVFHAGTKWGYGWSVTGWTLVNMASLYLIIELIGAK